LRRADQRGLKIAFFHNPGSEKSFDEVQNGFRPRLRLSPRP
jgi:hypothetical protein